MNTERAKEIGTCGGCGLIAESLQYDFPGSIPCLRYENGTAVHAALYLPSQDLYLNWEEEDGELVQVSQEEFEEALETFTNQFLDWEIEESAQILVERTLKQIETL